MNPEAQSELNRILAVGPVGLTEAEAGFLRARRSYLNEEQRTVFAEVLAANETPADTASTEEKSTETPTLARRGRKA